MYVFLPSVQLYIICYVVNKIILARASQKISGGAIFFSGGGGHPPTLPCGNVC
jgi:hypothetical protein